MTQDKWLLVDGTNTVYRDFYGGGADQAASMFIRRLTQLIDQFNPSVVVTAWDSGGSFRNSLYPAYKAGRTKPEGIEAALMQAKEQCGLKSIGMLSVEGFEADDILATLTVEAMYAGANAVLYSNDKDLHQLIDAGRVCQLLKVKRLPGPGNRIEMHWQNAASLFEAFGVRPDQWCDWKCLVGDDSDNIEGVCNIGPVTAKKILQVCGSIDRFYERPFAVNLSKSQHAAMINAKNEIPLLRELVTLRRDVPLPSDWKEVACVV